MMKIFLIEKNEIFLGKFQCIALHNYYRPWVKERQIWINIMQHSPRVKASHPLQSGLFLTVPSVSIQRPLFLI